MTKLLALLAVIANCAPVSNNPPLKEASTSNKDAPASDRWVTYRLHAVDVAPTEERTCGAVPRMLKDKHRVEVRDDGVYVNGARWFNVGELPGEVYLRKGEGYTSVSFYLLGNDHSILGVYRLEGFTEDRKPCLDTVRVEGSRQ